MRRDKEREEALEREIERIEQGGNAWEDAEEVEVEAKRPLDIVVPVRLASETWQALRKEAHQKGIGPSTLIRMWVLEKPENLDASQPA